MFSDIVLVVDGVEFKAHRNILYCACDYFRCLIEHDTCHEEDPDTLKRVDLGVISPCGFAEVLDFIYTGRIKLDLFNIERVFFTCDYLQFLRLTEACIRFVKKYMSSENAIWFLRLALSYSAPGLQDFCTGYIANHLSKIVKQQSFDSLNEDELLIILKDQRLIFNSEIKKKFVISGLPFLNEIQYIIDKWSKITSATKSQKEFLLSEVRKTLPNCQHNEEDCPNRKYFAAPIKTVFQTFNSFNFKHGDHPRLLAEFNTERVITYQDFPPDEWTIKKMTFYLHRLMEEEEHLVVAGVDIVYCKIWDSNQTGEFKCGLNSDEYDRESVTLCDHERITNLIITSREYIDCICLYTNLGNKLCQFGTPAHRVVHEDVLSQRDGFGLYFHGFSYVNYFDDARQFMNRLAVHYTSLDADKFKECFQKDSQRDELELN